MQFRADFGKSLRLSISKTEPALDDQPLFVIELRQESLELLLERPRNQDFIDWCNGGIPDQILEMRFIALSDRRAKRNLGRRSFHHAANILFGHPKPSRD